VFLSQIALTLHGKKEALHLAKPFLPLPKGREKETRMGRI
jgi:hypothetical protein